MDEFSDGGSYILLFVPTGRYHIRLEHWDELDAAYHHWIERKIDRVLELTCVDGGELLIAASRIDELCKSSPEIRERNHAHTDRAQGRSVVRR